MDQEMKYEDDASESEEGQAEMMVQMQAMQA